MLQPSASFIFMAENIIRGENKIKATTPPKRSIMLFKQRLTGFKRPCEAEMTGIPLIFLIEADNVVSMYISGI